MINHIISKYSKLTQKEYKTGHDGVGKVINKELCKKFRFDQMNKWCMHNPESVLENETCKFLQDFEIHTDHLTRPDDQTTRPSNGQPKKKKKKKKEKKNERKSAE